MKRNASTTSKGWQQADSRLLDTDVFDFIERFYNPRRRHSTLGQVSPDQFEKSHGYLRRVSANSGESQVQEFISQVTEAVMAEVLVWQSRPLERLYPVVFFDCLRVKIRDEGVVRNKAIYHAMLKFRQIRSLKS